jgi:protein phosphatase
MLRVAEHFSDSDTGLQRQGNEDSLFVRAPLFAVADGMGGAQAGEVASQMAVEAFDRGLADGSPAEALRTIVTEANRRIHALSREDDRRAGMGTTVTAAYVGEDEVTIAHVGDSRAYLLRRGELTRLTRDHSLVGELMARGKLTEEQAEHHPQRNVITRSVGPEPEVEVDTECYPGPGRRRLPDLLGRADLDGPRDRRAPDPPGGVLAAGGRPPADRGRQRGRRGATTSP